MRDVRHDGEELDRLVDLHRQHVADALAAPADRQRLGVEALAVADVARHFHVGQEAHLDRAHALAFAARAAALAGVEARSAPAHSRAPWLRASRRRACGSGPRSRCRWPGRSAASCRSASGRPRARGRSPRQPSIALQPVSMPASARAGLAALTTAARCPAARRAPASTCRSPTPGDGDQALQRHADVDVAAGCAGWRRAGEPASRPPRRGAG